MRGQRGYDLLIFDSAKVVLRSLSREELLHYDL